MLLMGAHVREVLDRATRGASAGAEIELPAHDARSRQRIFERVVLRLVSGRIARYPR
jgi:hypothetical protein